MFKSLSKGFDNIKRDVTNFAGDVKSEVTRGVSGLKQEVQQDSRQVANFTSSCYQSASSNMSMTSFFRKYSKGWTPRFTRDFDSRPTIRNTGKGSAKQRGYKPSDAGEPQSFDDLKAEMLGQGAMYEDPDFPASDESIYFKDPPSAWPDIEWLRPGEICDDPQMFVEGASRLDVNQGILGDCWLLAAVSCLATSERLLHRVIPNQSFAEGEYAGMFKFLFWQYGHWMEVIIDDRLPCQNGKLIYMHSDDRNEFWSALLEKAYAKLVGCYESLSGGLTSEALTDFTGGICERFELQDNAPADLFRQMLKAQNKGALMGCSIDATPGNMEAQLDNGLIIGHAYSLTDCRMMQVETPRTSGQIPMVRVRNPWGDSHEWTGAWSDGSEEWQLVPDEEKQELGLTYDHDGEFWMSYNDFIANYQRLEIVYLGPDTLVDEDEGDVAAEISKWEGNLCEGSWRRRVNAGGCRNFPETFWTNPQYRVSVEDVDQDDEDGNGSIIVALMQKERRKLRSEGKDNLTIGYAIYQLDDPDCGTLGQRFFQSHVSAGKSPSFINMREISDHHHLPVGHYCIVPSTFAADEEGDFVLRIFSERKEAVNELDDQTGTGDADMDELGDDTEDDDSKRDEGMGAFRELGGEDGEVDAYELKELLNGIFPQEFNFEGFSIDVCRSMVAMLDADMSGKLGYKDYQTLWEDLNLCRKAFRQLDTDGNGYFNSYEFKRVLNTIAYRVDSLRGLRLSNSTFNAIVMRYSDKDGHVTFDDFVACVIKLKLMFGVHKDKDTEGFGSATFEMDEFIQLTMYS